MTHWGREEVSHVARGGGALAQIDLHIQKSCTCIRICTHTYTCTCTRTSICTCTCTNTRTRTCTHTHIRIWTRTGTHIILALVLVSVFLFVLILRRIGTAAKIFCSQPHLFLTDLGPAKPNLISSHPWKVVPGPHSVKGTVSPDF
jgi:hypothetical protein